MSGPPALVVVTGPPAAGKTTLAVQIAGAARVPLLSRDVLKERLFDTVGWSDRAWSQRVGRASFALLLQAAARTLAAGSPCVVEANFDPAYAADELTRLPPHRFVQVVCIAPEDVLVERFRARAAAGGRHPGHVDDVVLLELPGALAAHRFGPIPLPGECHEVGPAGADAAAVAAIVAAVSGHAPAFDPPLVIVLTGAPATGKTRVAEELAKRLRIPLVSKDALKEPLYETFDSGDEIEERIDRAALAILFSVVRSQLEAGVSVVAESNFDSESDPEPFRLLARERELELVQIHCHASREAITHAFARRAESGNRHPGHEDEAEDAAEVGAKLDAGYWDPMDIPGELIELPVLEADVDFDALAERIRQIAT